MAAINVLFTRIESTALNSTSIVDGQLIYVTDTGAIYLDNGTARIQIGNSNTEYNTLVSDITQNTQDILTKANQSALLAHINDIGNPHQVTAMQVGLGNVDNTADVDKPISTSTQTALNLKANQTSLDSTNTNVSNLQTSMVSIENYIGYTESYILGLQADFESNTFTRLAGATNLNAGTDFDSFNMYGGRKRCNVANNGTINAYYGDTGYIEDGTNGQVMVYQPVFYYKVVPLKLDKNTLGYHLRKANYYISDKPLDGFKRHPAFYDINGKEIDYILYSAFEGCIYDTSASAYLLHDEQNMDTSTDLFSSIAGAKPSSGLSQNLTRANINTLCTNRGTGWYGDNVKAESANQMLMAIELGYFNTQAKITDGVVSIADNNSYNCSSLTGSTTGNATNIATSTINEINGVQTTYTTNGKISLSYRGIENPWGNMWKFVDGFNIWGDGNFGGGIPYICNNYNYIENKNTDNYISANFSVTNASGYISAFGYSEDCDWLFMASECTGNSSLPVGDYTYVVNLNGFRIGLLGGDWYDGAYAGGFYWCLDNGSGDRNRGVGGRLLYIPTSTIV